MRKVLSAIATGLALMTTRRRILLFPGLASLTLVGACSSVASNDAPSVSAIDPMLEDAAIIKTLDNGCFIVALDSPEKGGDAEPQVVCPVVGGSNQ